MRNVLLPIKSNSNSFNDKKNSNYSSINYPVNYFKREKSNVQTKFFINECFENLFPTDKNSFSLSKKSNLNQYHLNLNNYFNISIKNNLYEEKTIKKNYKMIIPAIYISVSESENEGKNIISNIIKILKSVEYSYYSISEYKIRVLFNSFTNCLNIFSYLEEYFQNSNFNIDIRLNKQDDTKSFNQIFDENFNKLIEESKKNSYFETLQKRKIIELNSIILKNNLSDKYIFNLNHSLTRYIALFFVQIEIADYYFLFDILLDILSLSNDFLKDLLTIKLIGKNLEKFHCKYRIDKNQKLSIRVSSLNHILFNEICDLINLKLKFLYEEYKNFVLFNSISKDPDYQLSVCVKYDKFPCL
jgi:hypothetical protein